jgi:gamma-syntrophin
MKTCFLACLLLPLANPKKKLFLSRFSVSRDTPESDNDNDATCAELKADEGWRSAQNNNNNVHGGATMNNTFSNSSFNSMNNNSNHHRPNSLCSEPEIRWVDIISVPLMMAYVTRYIYGTDKLRTNAFEVRGLNATSTGVIHLDDLAILSSWLKYITDNIVGLTNLQVRAEKDQHWRVFMGLE